MKTNTLKSVAALVSAAAILSNTTFAGPGPQDHSQPARSNSAKTTVAVAQAVKAPAADLKSTASTTQRATHLVYNAHGGVIVL